MEIITAYLRIFYVVSSLFDFERSVFSLGLHSFNLGKICTYPRLMDSTSLLPRLSSLTAATALGLHLGKCGRKGGSVFRTQIKPGYDAWDKDQGRSAGFDGVRRYPQNAAVGWAEFK